VQKIGVGKYLASVALGACVLSSSPLAAASTKNGDEPSPAVAVHQVRVAPAGGLRDEFAMVLLGTALIGLAAAVRRAA
jgi:hypothetical protein